MKFKLLVILSVSVACSIFATVNNYSYKKKSQLTPLIKETGGYENEWKKIDALQAKGLTASALEVVETVYNRAKAENNAPQLVKAIIYRMKFVSLKEESSLAQSIDKLNEELKAAKYPLTPLLHSIIAETYWKYFQNNRWKFYDRSQIVNAKPSDIVTWDIKTIIAAAVKHYQLSLQPSDSLKHTRLDIYDEVLIKQKDSRKFRPTLYDFMAHRAIDFYSNEESSISLPFNKFELTDSVVFANYTTFGALKFTTGDSLSFHYYAIKLFQELLKFHTADADPEALVVLDVERLKFMNAHAVIQNKKLLYIKALKQLEQQFIKLPVATEASYEIANLSYNNELSSDPLKNDKSNLNYKEALRICNDAVTRFPSSYGATECRSLIDLVKQKNIALTIEEVNLPDKPFLALLNYRNVSKLYFRAIQLPYINNPSINRYEETALEKYLGLKTVKEWSIDLPADDDYQPHSTEIKMPALPAGNYVILAGTDKGFASKNNGVAHAGFLVSNISYISRQGKAGYEFYLFNRKTGEPLSGVNAQLTVSKYDYNKNRYTAIPFGTYNSNEQGYFLTQLKNENGANFNVQFSYGKDTLVTDNNFYLYNVNKEEKQKTIHTFFFTDRAIYRPGQTIYFKGIVLETDGENNQVKENYSSTVTLYDLNNQKVTDVKLTTNTYGTFNGSFTAPNNVLNGSMRIADEKGEVYISVEEYKRPKYEVQIAPVKGSFRLNEMITVTGFAKAYAGAAIDGAQVKYRVVRNAVFDWWYKPNGHFPASPEMEIVNGTAATNDTGAFALTFKALPDLSVDKELKPAYNYTIYADVTDLNGETQSAQYTISIGYSALAIKIDLPKQINKDSVARFALIITNRVGQPENATGKIEVYKLNEPVKLIRKRKWNSPDRFMMTKEEFNKDFQQDAYMDEGDTLKWERGSKITTLAFDTKKEKTFELPITTMQAGVYVLEAKTTDVYGEEVATRNYFTVYSAKGKDLPNAIDWFTVIKGKGEPGEKASFIIGSKTTNVKILYEVEHKNEIIKREWLTLNQEQKLIELPLEEKYRGNVVVHFLFVKNNRVYTHTETVIVPYTNKELDISFETFRSKLTPGQQEEWKLKIKAKNGEKLAAEMLAAMYDASLDAFKVNKWNFDIYNNYYAQLNWSVTGRFGSERSILIAPEWNSNLDFQSRLYDALNWFGYMPDRMSHVYYSQDRGSGALSGKAAGVMVKNKNSITNEITLGGPPPAQYEANDVSVAGNAKPEIFKPELNKEQSEIIPVRKNLTETAFFFPALQTDENGNVIIKFNTPEALTKWKFMALAHTHDLKYAQVSKELITQKELMIIPNAPRFFREKDRLVFTGKVTNLSAVDLQGSAQLALYDAITMKDITSQIIKDDRLTIDFATKKGQSTGVSWNLIIPEGVSAITYKITARSGPYGDGEEMTLPVLSNRILVTESMPLAIGAGQTKTFILDKLLKSGSSTTLRNHKVTLEFTANPAWYAIQALPYMMELPDGCSEQLFSRFYANSIASHIATSSPKIQAVFNAWKNAGANKESLITNLEKNQELKAILLEETPWVLDAKDETERQSRLGILFDFNKMSYELDNALGKLQKMQSPDGGWPWFEGMPNDRYITQYIISGMGHLDRLAIKNIRNDAHTWNMVQQGVSYLDAAIREDYERLITDKIKLTENNLSYLQIQYLYARSYFKDIAVDEKSKKAVDYYRNQAQKFWLKNSPYMQGMLALALKRDGNKQTVQDILKSLKENALHNEELGMYWKENKDGYYWHQAFVESQALLTEVFDEVANDKKSVDELRISLLKSKQTQSWKTTKATAEACYALLLRGTDWLTTGSDVSITIGSQQISTGTNNSNLNPEAGTGYFKKVWDTANITPELGKVLISKKDSGISWGALYWQYFEQLDKITSAKTSLSAEKQVYLQQAGAAGPVIAAITEKTKLKTGDKLKIRITLRVDRDMEYVHLKDMRASGFEPTNVFSGYRWQDGLGYYETTQDAATHFFFSYLPKGTYVFEYPLLISHNGDFSNGITTLQCMYAPEFSSHSEGIRIKVGN